VGLAAQQTFANLFAGVVLLSARPFRVGDRIRLQAGALGGVVEGIVIDSGLLYTSLGRGADRIHVPNNVVLNSVVVPIREPGAVDLRARVQPGVTPTEIQSLLEDVVTTPVRSAPDVRLEEVAARETIVRVNAEAVHGADGPQLANEVLSALRTCRSDQEVDDCAPIPREGVDSSAARVQRRRTYVREGQPAVHG